MVSFKGAEISRLEADGMRDLQYESDAEFKFIKKFGPYTPTTSFMTENNHVSCLCCHSINLRKLPKSIGNFKWLRECTLIKTTLTQLPETIGRLSKLEKLHISLGHLKRLPDSIGNLSSLEKL